MGAVASATLFSNHSGIKSSNFYKDQTTSTPQLPFMKPQIPSNRDHKALNRSTLRGLGRKPKNDCSPVELERQVSRSNSRALETRLRVKVGFPEGPIRVPLWN